MASSLQQPLPPMLLKRVADETAPVLNEVESDELPLASAEKLAGEIVAAVLHETQLPLKAYGDKGAVSRWKAGTENPNLARLIQRVDARKIMAKRLLQSCDDVEVVEEWRVISRRKDTA